MWHEDLEQKMATEKMSFTLTYSLTRDSSTGSIRVTGLPVHSKKRQCNTGKRATVNKTGGTARCCVTRFCLLVVLHPSNI